jgi:hypothetical protein
VVLRKALDDRVIKGRERHKEYYLLGHDAMYTASIVRVEE